MPPFTMAYVEHDDHGFHTGMSPVELFHSHNNIDEGGKKEREIQRGKKQERMKKKKTSRSGASIASKHTV